MSSIDQRVVQMKFDNAQFEQGVKQTLNSLDALNKGLKLEGATKGLTELGNVSNRINLGPLGSAIDFIASKFKNLSIIGITALTNIVNKAVNAGTEILHSLTFEPIISGLHEYETNLNSIQTTLANTGLEGQKGLDTVNAALKQLNDYSDQTIYNFSEMARNIGTFTAAGVKLEVAVAAIKGISNLAAISGSSAEQASTAMYQLSQAISAGKVSLEDWNSVVNAGLGGKVFQNALIETARVHGVAIDQMIKDEGSFRMTLQKGWLTSSILTETLQKFTGDLTASQLKAMGYNDQQIAGILKMGKTAQEAATKIKTVSQLLNTLQEAAGSGWTQTWQLIFGDFEEAKTLFTNVYTVLGGFINASADARNEILKDWKDLGGRTVLIEAIANAFNALIAVVKPIKEAFREIFPAVTGKQLYEITLAIRNFTAGLKIGANTAENLRRTFAGVFAVLGIGWDIIKEGAKTLFHLFGIATEGTGSFLEVTAGIGDFLVGVRQAIRDGNLLTAFFERVGKVLEVPIKIILLFTSAIGSLFKKFDSDKAIDSVSNFVEHLEPLGRLADVMLGAWSKLPAVLSDVAHEFAPIASKMSAFFSRLGKAITESLRDLDFSRVLETIRTGLFGTLVLALVSFINKLRSGVGAGENLLDRITRPFEELTGTLKAMQNTLRATTLLEIAAAIGILTISVVALSKIDSEGLKRALSAMAVMFTELFGTLILFEKFADTGDIAKISLISGALILLAIAVDLLTVAVKNLSELNWNELARGLTGLTVILAELVAVVRLMPNEAKLTGTSAALVILGVAVKILASAVKDFADLDWEEIAKGLVGVGAILGALVLFTKFVSADKAGVLQGAGIVLLAAGVKILASAVKDFAELNWKEIARGLVAMAGGLALMAAALILVPPTSVLSAAAIFTTAASLGMIADALKNMGGMKWGEIARGITSLAGALTLISAALILIPPTSVISAGAIFITAASLGMIGDALKDMSKMSWGEIAKGLVSLAGALLIIAVGTNAMVTALPGAAALLVVSAALAVLAPILALFGSMSWGEIGKGLLTLAGIFVILGAAGIVLGPLVPVLIGLGAAITLLGAGIALAGAGVFLFAAGLTALSVAGAAGTVALVAMVTALSGLIPTVMVQLANGIIAFANVISTAGPAFTAAIVTVLLAIMSAIDTLSPKIVDTLFKLLTLLLETMVKYVPRMTDAGYKILIGVLKGIANNINGVVAAATDVVVNFINALGKNQPRVIQAGVDFIISFINGLANAIRSNSAKMGEAGANLGTAIVEGMVKGMLGGSSKIVSSARSVAQQALNAAKNLLGIHSPSTAFEEVGENSDKGLANGLDGFSHIVEKAAENVGKDALNSISRSLSSVTDLMGSEVDLNPTIRPVLDLTDVRSQANNVNKLLSTTPMPVKAVYLNASKASISSAGNLDEDNKSGVSGSTGGFVFNQYNSSPKALSTAEIYRQTNNQLSAVRGALPV